MRTERIKLRPTRANNIKLIRKKPLADELDVSPDTIDDWVRKKKFPRPIFTSDGAPARWRLRDVEAWLQKRSVARRKLHERRMNLRQYQT